VVWDKKLDTGKYSKMGAGKQAGKFQITLDLASSLDIFGAYFSPAATKRVFHHPAA
jgi:hypothetical protein